VFTGIIESQAEVKEIRKEGSNFHILLKSELIPELYIDQSISHNGVCLTVVEIESDYYVVTAIDETLKKTNLKSWKEGSKVNLERSMTAEKRLDGHFVQGHVDTTTKCIEIKNHDGSWIFTFNLPDAYAPLVVDKGSITINGTSLTLLLEKENEFSVAIIPYTYTHTNFSTLKVGDEVNLEFDILGKYVNRIMKLKNS
jgi:riboflavin synthase